MSCYDYNAAPNPASQEVGILWGYQVCCSRSQPEMLLAALAAS